MKKILSILFIISTISFPQHAWNFDPMKVPEQPPREFQALAFFITQGVTSNFYASNDLLKGQIVGRLFSGNTTQTGSQAFYFEQRLLPFFIYQPNLLNGKAILRASFEIDWTWGDASYGVGGNFGSAFNADQVNIQTQNVELELIPAKGWAINLGLQRLFDTPYNPYRTMLNTMLNTGYRLAYWGSDGVGISIRNDKDWYRWKAGYYQLYENNVQQFDDVTLWETIADFDITPNWRQGFSLWYVYDRGNGEGGVSILGQGLNSLLNDYNGTFQFNFNGADYRADIFWLGTYSNYNAEFNLGRWSLNSFIVANFGQALTNTKSKPNVYNKTVDILGVAANLRAGYKYGQTIDDIISADLIFATGDDNNIKDGKYSGVITGNTWGSPGAIFVSSGAYLLYPHANVVNRYISAVPDLSNIGLGQFGGTVNFSHGFIPNKLIGKIGIATALSQYSPFGGGNFIGFEVNGKLSFVPAVFMNIELHAAYLSLGDFYDSKIVNSGMSKRPDNPWTIFTTFKWLMF